MANALDRRGIFWWFQATNKQTSSLETGIPGHLTISEEGHIRLQLDGPLWFEDPKPSLRWDSSRWLSDECKIAGQLIDEDKPYVLLLRLFRTDFSLAADKPIRQSYEADQCLATDTTFPQNFDLERFQALRIDLAGLEEWLQLDSIQVESEFPSGDRTEAKVSYKNHKFTYETPTASVIVENLILGMPLFFLSNGAMREINIHQTNWLIYRPKALSIMTHLDTAFVRMEEFIALLLGRYFRLDWPYFVCTNDNIESWYRFYSLRGARGEQLSWSIFLWTSFPSLQDVFGSLLVRWQEIAERHGASCRLYISSLRNPHSQPEHEFVNLVWAMESLHRSWQRGANESIETTQRRAKIEAVLDRFANSEDKKLRKWLEGKLKYAYEPSLEDRIVEVLSRLPIRIETDQLRSFAKQCAKRRNEISHEGGAPQGEDAEIFQAEIRKLAEALRHLFHAALLHEIGVGPEIIVTAVTHSTIATRDILPALEGVGINLWASDPLP